MFTPECLGGNDPQFDDHGFSKGLVKNHQLGKSWTPTVFFFLILHVEGFYFIRSFWHFFDKENLIYSFFFCTQWFGDGFGPIHSGFFFRRSPLIALSRVYLLWTSTSDSELTSL